MEATTVDFCKRARSVGCCGTTVPAVFEVRSSVTIVGLPLEKSECGAGLGLLLECGKMPVGIVVELVALTAIGRTVGLCANFGKVFVVRVVVVV